jgi:cobalt/nickel transport system permease protein
LMSSVVWIATAAHVTTPSSPDESAAQSRLYRLDPRAKLVSAIVFAVCVSLITQLWPLVIAFIAALVIFLVSGLRPRAISRQIRVVALLILMIALPVYFFRGLEAFAAMLLRITSATLVLLAMILTTASADLVNGLRRLGLPKTFVTLLAMTYRYLFLYGDEVKRMTRARESRGVGHGRSILDRRVLQTISSTAGLILVKAYGRATRIHRAMKARGYSGEAVGGRRLRMRVPDGGLIVTMSVLSVFLLLMNWGFVQWMRL